jgi:hypothetical protein
MDDTGSVGGTALYDSEVVKKAGLTPYDFAVLVDVTPATVYGWMKGRTPSKHIRTKVSHAVDRLAKWVEAGKLPRPDRTDKAAVVEKIKAALNK